MDTFFPHPNRCVNVNHNNGSYRSLDLLYSPLIKGTSFFPFLLLFLLLESFTFLGQYWWNKRRVDWGRRRR